MKTKEQLVMLHEDFYGELSRVVEDMRAQFDMSDSDEVMKFVEIALDVFGFDLGYFAGLATLSGADRMDRDRVLTGAVRDGKKYALDQHAESGDCDCTGSRELSEEVYPN